MTTALLVMEERTPAGPTSYPERGAQGAWLTWSDGSAPPLRGSSLAAEPRRPERGGASAQPGWGARPSSTPALLRPTAAAACAAVLVAAGLRAPELTTAEFWARRIPMSPPRRPTAIPVAELRSAQILLAPQAVHPISREIKERERYPDAVASPGAYGSRVGLLGPRRDRPPVPLHLRRFRPRRGRHRPAVARSRGRGGASACAWFPLSRALRTACEARQPPTQPLVEQQPQGLVDGELLARLRTGATLVNTAPRGAVVTSRRHRRPCGGAPNLTAVFSTVTWPEPAAIGSPACTACHKRRADNARILARGDERRTRARMGELVLEEGPPPAGGSAAAPRRVDPAVASHSERDGVGPGAQGSIPAATGPSTSLIARGHADPVPADWGRSGAQ
ncbi:hypothetical protein [Nonomuraea dietziae]|uniref:hypothetical protein n=1 Tax=Nonomuraea dietziae TaxID=65515 RepID=UPI0031D99D95